MKQRLQDQPYQVLCKLIEHSGEIVSREELRSTLWHDDTFVDFETALNTAIKRLRETLGDSAENPTFIETLPRRGYRFIPPVEWPAGIDRRNSVPSNPREDPIPNGPQKSSSGRSHLRRHAFTSGIAVVVLICLGYWRSEPRPPVVTNIVRLTNDGKAKNPINPPATDGVHLYFTEGMPYTTGSRIAQVSDAGGETTWIPSTLRDVWAVSSVSPNRSELFFSRGPRADAIELWVQPLPAGAPHRVGSVSALLASWTPDGKHIVYAEGGAITIANEDGSEPHPLAKVPGMVFSIRYSPDGKHVRFDLKDTKTGSNSIWEMDADGKNVHPLFPNWNQASDQSGGHWSPDGDYYYFQAGTGDAQAIWVMPERRSIFGRPAKGPSRLTSGPLRFSSPVPSSDGRRLFVMGEDTRVELERYDMHAERFDPFLQGISAGPVDFSEDGKWMVYVSYPEMTLWRSRVDGSDKMQLTFPPIRAYEPRWSPDGSQIVFMDVRFDRPWNICLIPPSGGRPETLRSSNSNEGDPTWTPDGQSIVFAKVDKMGNGSIYVMNLKNKSVSAVQDSDRLFSPRMSPNGRYISALTTSQSKLMLFDTYTKHWSSLTESGLVGYNEWSHDGKYIYFRSNRDGVSEIERVRIRDRLVEHVLSLKDFPQLSDSFALWIGLTPDDAVLLMRDRSVQEIYALALQFP